jgi:hypothetical protein
VGGVTGLDAEPIPPGIRWDAHMLARSVVTKPDCTRHRTTYTAATLSDVLKYRVQASTVPVCPCDRIDSPQALDT